MNTHRKNVCVSVTYTALHSMCQHFDVYGVRVDLFFFTCEIDIHYQISELTPLTEKRDFSILKMSIFDFLSKQLSTESHYLLFVSPQLMRLRNLQVASLQC